MQKLILSCSVAVCLIATAAVTSVEAKSDDIFWDSRSPQVIEKITGNIVTFKNVAGESNNYYIPNWVFSEYNLQVGNSANVYSRKMDRVDYGNGYIAESTPKFVNTSSLDSRSKCIPSQRYLTQSSSSTKQVLLTTKDCLSTIPITGVISGSMVRILSIDIN
jgi:hypothetical protein